MGEQARAGAGLAPAVGEVGVEGGRGGASEGGAVAGVEVGFAGQSFREQDVVFGQFDVVMPVSGATSFPVAMNLSMSRLDSVTCPAATMTPLPMLLPSSVVPPASPTMDSLEPGATVMLGMLPSTAAVLKARSIS